MAEQILSDLGHADAQWQSACLRYFNPVGAHDSGLIGEDPAGTPNNLMPYVAQVRWVSARACRSSAATTPRPTAPAWRDYIHVVDLAEGHVAALRRLFDAPGSFTVNRAPAAATACSTWCGPTSRPAAGPCPTTSCRGGPGRGRLLGRSAARAGTARLERAARPGGDVRRQLALAAGHPRGFGDGAA